MLVATRRWEQLHERNLIGSGNLPQADWNRTFLPQYFVKQPSRMHEWLCERLDTFRSDRGRINLIAPRSGAKSTIGCTAYPLRCAVEGSEPLIWIVSNTKAQAVDQLRTIREELEGNTDLATAHPSATGKGPTWRDDFLVLNNGVAIKAYGTGQKIRGSRYRHSRPSLIVCDDLQSDEVIYSASRRDKEWTWFNGTLMRAGDPDTCFLHLCTALHRDGIGTRLARTPGWESRAFSAIERWPEHMGLWEQWEEIYTDLECTPEQAREFFEQHRRRMELGAEVLWPDREDLYSLMEERVRSGRSTFEREKQGRPANPEDAEWPDSYFDDAWFDEWPAQDSMTRTLAVDPSKGKDARRGDYSAIVWIGLAGGILYVDADLQRRPTPKIVSDTAWRVGAWRPHAWGVEANNFQELLGPEIEQALADLGVFGSAPQLIENRVRKQVRIRRLGPWLAQRRIKFKAGSPGALLLVSQLKDFPDPHSHDDGPDALEMAVGLLEAATQEFDDPFEGMGSL